MIMISSRFIFNFTIFCAIASFLTKLRTLGILFSTAVGAVVGAKLVIIGISFSTSFILISYFILRVVLVAKLVMSGILSLIFLILALYTSFLTNVIFYYITLLIFYFIS